MLVIKLLIDKASGEGAMKKLMFILLAFIISCTPTFSSVNRWVSPIGLTTSLESCKGSTPIDGVVACSLDAANKGAQAGDIINLRGGIYTNQNIEPIHSGLSSNKIIFRAYNGEQVILDDTGEEVGFPYHIGIFLDGVNYIVIDGIEVRNWEYLVRIYNGASYNEIKNCKIHHPLYSITFPAGVAVQIADPRQDGGGSNHNWIHHNTIYHHGHIDSRCEDVGGLIGVGFLGSYISNHTTIEDNELYHGGHFLTQVNTQYNVFRDNVGRNDAFMIDESPGCNPATTPWRSTNKWGNRLFSFNDGNSRDGIYNLVEGNRGGYASNPPDGGGSDGIVLTGKQNIVRYNTLFDIGEKGLFFKQITNGDSDNNRTYNNTLHKIGYSYGQLGNVSYAGIFIHANSANNVVKNTVVDNFHPNVTQYINDKSGTAVLANNWTKPDGDPLFSNTDLGSINAYKTQPDLTLQPSSKLINAGTWLTRAHGSGNLSTTLIVEDANYFQDATWGSALANLQADHIAVGTTNNTTQIKSINYLTKTITLVSPISWSDGANIWLYKDSKGRVVLHGNAPDIGAHEYDDQKTLFMSQPQRFRVIQ